MTQNEIECIIDKALRDLGFHPGNALRAADVLQKLIRAVYADTVAEMLHAQQTPTLRDRYRLAALTGALAYYGTNTPAEQFVLTNAMAAADMAFEMRKVD
jgi:hypothetical protein